MATKNLAEDPYERLANAIIIQASKDYMTNLRKKKRNPGSASAEHDIRECERFFRSGWYQGSDFRGWRVFNSQTEKSNMTIRVNPREINFQSEVRDDGKRIFESGIKYRQEHQQ